MNYNLNLNQINEIIKILKNQPGLLANLVLKPNLFVVIYQAFLNGMIDEVACIYNSLSIDDKKTFDEFSLGYFYDGFIGMDFDKILRIYGNNNKYPGFFDIVVSEYLAQGNFPAAFTPQLRHLSMNVRHQVNGFKMQFFAGPIQ